MTVIDVHRATTAEDEYGDPKPTTWSLWKSFDGLVGWGNPDESVEPGRNTVITNRTVYIEGSAPTGILATDRCWIDGVEYSIEGKVAEWDPSDGYVGAQFAVKAVT
ncbi:MAG: hypothetical protein ABWY57_15995 [Mycetocola sp.]